MSDAAKWFRPLGTCACGKPATGHVMSERNAPMGHYCTRCGERRVARAAREREDEQRRQAAGATP